MADIKFTELAEDTSPTGDDLIVTVHNPLGIPVNRKVQLQNISGFFEPTIYLSNAIVNSLPTERSHTGTTYTIKKEFTIKKAGTYRITFELKSSSSADYAYGRIYKNSVAFGTERSTLSLDYVSFSEDLAFAIGDKCQLYIKGQSAGVTAYTRNFMLKTSIYATEDID